MNKARPGPATTREMKTLMFDLLAVIKKHKHMGLHVYEASWMLVGECHRILANDFGVSQLKVMEMFENSANLVRDGLKTGKALFDEEIPK
jgi:hypothetical protein